MDPNSLQRVSSEILKYHQQLRSICDEHGRNITEQFKALPPRTENPEYYHRIQTPISFQIIRSKIDSNQYASVDQWMADVHLLINNARQFPHQPADVHAMRQFLEVIRPRQDSAVPRPVVRQIPGQISGQAKFLTMFIHNNTKYCIGDNVSLRNPEDSQAPLVGHVLRCWKASFGYGCVVSLFLKPSHPTQEPDPQILPNEIYASPIFRNYSADDILEHVVVEFGSREPKSGSFVCRYFYDVPRSRFYPFVYPLNTEASIITSQTILSMPNSNYSSYLQSLQSAIDQRRNFKNDSRKVYCTFTPRICPNRSFNSIDGLLKHAYDHIVSVNERHGTLHPSLVSPSSIMSGLSQRKPPIPPAPPRGPSLPANDYPIQYQELEVSSDEPRGDLFRRYNQNGLLWFATPPLNIQPDTIPLHSADYLLFKQSDSRFFSL